jgi:hypothetical protein
VENAPGLLGPVYFSDLSPEAVPSENGMSRGATTVFPALHTLYDYNEGF